MAEITLAQAEAELAFWLAESRKLSYGVTGISVSRDQRHASEMIKFWNGEVKKLTHGGIKIIAGTPV